MKTRAFPQVNPVEEYDPSISFWPDVESEEGRDTGLIDLQGNKLLWYPDQIGFVRDEDFESP
jgi:hypothetical protein